MEHAATDPREQLRLALEQLTQVQHAVEEFETPTGSEARATAISRADAALRDAIKLLEGADLSGA